MKTTLRNLEKICLIKKKTIIAYYQMTPKWLPKLAFKIYLQFQK